MRTPSCLISGLLLAFTLACTGGSDPAPTVVAPPATGLVYTDPAGTGWRLVRDAASTPTRIVLNLVGPAGLRTRGLGFNLQAPAAVRFGAFTRADLHPSTTGWPVNDTGVYELRNTDPRDHLTGEPLPPDPLEPILLAGAVKKGNLLTVGLFQKDRRASAKDSGAPLCQIAIEFLPSAQLRAAEELPLKILKAKFIAEDIGAFGVDPTVEMVEKGQLQPMTIALGVLRGN